MTVVAGVAVRTGQALIEATPTLLCGFLVAGILRRMVGAAGVRRAFGTGGWRGVVRGWAFGMLLPVCSLGVIPVARELRRCGVADGTVLAFVLAAPLLNPISFLYGLTLSEPIVILTFAATSLILALILGQFWTYAFSNVPDTAPAESAEQLPAPGIKRLVAVAETTAREATGPVLKLALLGVAGSGLMAAALPFGMLQTSMKYDDLTAPLQMTAVALPAFNSPLNGMMKLGLMFDHGNSVAAAFVLFIMGLGINIGLVVWIASFQGLRRAAVWFVAVVTVCVITSYVLQIGLPTPARAEDHTHAFDDYSNPFTSATDISWPILIDKLKQKAEVLEWVAMPLWVVAIVSGMVARWLHRHYPVERWLTQQPATPSGVGKYDIVIPGPVLAGIALLGLVAFSVLGAYIYYPDTEPALNQLHALRADVAAAVAGAQNPHSKEAARKRTEAIRELEQMDLAVRKLMVGVYIRRFRLSAEQKTTADTLREKLEAIRDELLTGDPAVAYEIMRRELGPAYIACRNAYKLPEPHED
ncbi:MAG: permease [Gemmataceae bacterium]|nr:permease [Gemmata sp.]MDW8196111.1 permease [Gemmataceae bacterium]